MRVRCEYPSASNYAYYGGRGISVCNEWKRDPTGFVRWALASGWSKGLEIDRIDTDGDYTPANCRVINHRENSQRTRRITTTLAQARQVRQLLKDGYSIKDAAREAGVTYMVAWHLKNNPNIWNNQE